MISDIQKTFEEMMTGYQLLQSGFEWNDTMHIPFQAVSPNTLTPSFLRMKVYSEDKFAFLQLEVNKTMTSQIIELLKDPSQKNYRNWHFEGPQGIGKSFAFLHLVLQLRRFHKEYRLIYVNNPNEWRNLEWSYIVNEVIYAFAEDEKTFSIFSNTFTLSQWYERLWTTEFKNRRAVFIEFLETARDYCDKKGLTLIAVLDQENEIANLKSHSQSPYPFPFDLYEQIQGSKYIITCASANNWTILKKNSTWRNLGTMLQIPVGMFTLPGKL